MTLATPERSVGQQPDAAPSRVIGRAGGAADIDLTSDRAIALGRRARRPTQIPWTGWKRVLKRTASEVISDRVSLASAGCAFYAVLAMFPAISMLVALYGLLFDPHTVEQQMSMLRNILPSTALELISNRVHQLVTKPPGTLTFSFVISLMITLWSASAGTKSLLSALNIAYEEKETRSFLRYQGTALAMTLSGILGTGLAVALLVALPPILTYVPERLGLSDVVKEITGWIRLGSFLLMLCFVVGALSMVYRFGPARRAPNWGWVSPGSILATVLWLLASVLFSYYVGHIASYDATYGPLGAIVGMMMWFYVTAFVVLVGAELNAELELQTAEDSTSGGVQPLGQRGAYVADHVAKD
jgi:membrane protein